MSNVNLSGRSSTIYYRHNQFHPTRYDSIVYLGYEVTELYCLQVKSDFRVGLSVTR